MKTAASVVAVGGCGVGLSFAVDEFPVAGETVMARSVEYVNGGKAANHAIGLRRLGITSSLLSARGEDPMGLRVASLLAEHDVDQSGMLVGASATMVGTLLVEVGGENLIVVAPGILGELSAASMREREGLLRAAGTVIVSLEVPLDAAVEALRIARRAGSRTVLNLSPSPSLERIGELLSLSDIVVLNLGEARAAANADEDAEPTHVAAELLRMGADAVVMTLGERGALVATQEYSVARPAAPVGTIVDTSGAGDAFMCGLVAALHRGLDLTAAADLGGELAARILRGRGFVEALSYWDDTTGLA